MSFAFTRESPIAPSHTKCDRRLIPLLGAAFAILVWSHPLAKGAPHPERQDKIDRALAADLTAPGNGHVRVIVKTHADARSRIREALDGHGGRITADHPTISAFSAVIHRRDVDSLVSDPDVEGVSLDAVVRADQTKADARTSSFVATEVPAGSPAGGSVRVAVIDSGIEPTRDLGASRLIGFYDFTRDGVSGPAYDDYGHGTHVAGLIGGRGASSGRYYRGIAPAAKILALKVLDRNGAGYTSTVIRAIDFI